MTDNLIYSIGFDLEKGVEEASKDWEKYASRLEKAIQKRAISVKLKIDTENINGLDSAIMRLEKLNLGGVTKNSPTEIIGFKRQLAELPKATSVRILFSL